MAQVAPGTGTNQAFKLLSHLMCKEVKMPEGYHKSHQKKPFSPKGPQVEEREGEITLEQCYCSKARQAGHSRAHPCPQLPALFFFLRP